MISGFLPPIDTLFGPTGKSNQVLQKINIGFCSAACTCQTNDLVVHMSRATVYRKHAEKKGMKNMVVENYTFNYFNNIAVCVCTLLLFFKFICIFWQFFFPAIGDKIWILIIDQELACSTSCYTAHSSFTHTHSHLHGLLCFLFSYRLSPSQVLVQREEVTWTHTRAHTHALHFSPLFCRLSHTTTSSSSSLLSVSHALRYTQGYLPPA